MDKLGQPLRTGRDEQRFYDTDIKTDSTVKSPNELLPVKKYYKSVQFICFAKMFLLSRKVYPWWTSAAQYVFHRNAVGEE